MTLPDRRTISLRGLQAFMLINAVIAIVGGGSFVLSGIDGVERVLGSQYPELKPMLSEAAAAMAAEARVSFDHFYRVLGWYWVMTGTMLLWITPSVATTTSRAENEAITAQPMRQSQPSGFTTGSIVRPIRPRML